jgi:hypothetical protein
VITASTPAYYLVVTSIRGSTHGALLTGLGWLAISCPALAQAPTRLEYTAPSDCASRTDFVAAVAARDARFDDAENTTVDPARGHRTLHVSIRPDAAGYVGSFHVQEAANTSGARELHANTCAEVVEALAVVSAIALREAPAPVSVSAAPTAKPASPPPSSAPPAPEPKRRPLRTIGYFNAEKVAVEAGDVTFDRDYTSTLSAGFTTGVLPSLLPRFDLTLSRTNFVTVPDAENYQVGPTLRVRWSFLGPGTYRSDGFTTDLWGLKAGFGVCRSLVYDTNGFVAQLCAEFGVGTLSFDTKDESGAIVQTKTLGLGSAGLEADLRYNLGKHFHVALQAGGEIWTGDPISAEKPDGSRLFKGSMFHGFGQLGLGLNY